jgi:glycosyltransferase involved in cell wall biosynthesis
MRVLQLGPYSPPHGGVQGHVVALRRYLQSQAVTCDVIDLNQQRRTDGDGVYGPRNWLELMWHLVRSPANIVHLHIGGNLTNRLLGLILICAWLPARKSVLTFHSGGYPTSPEGKSAAPRSFRGFILLQLDRVIGVNQEIVDVFKRYGLSPRQVTLIEPHYLPEAVPDVELPKQFRTFFEKHSPVLISVGLLEAEYDLPLQIKIVGRLLRRFPHLGLIMIGSGSLDKTLRQQIKSTSYEGHILLAGDVDRQVTLKVIAESNLFLRTTLFDGDSISLREAVHFGVPSIATDRAPRPPQVKLIPAEDIEALQESIERELIHPTKKLVSASADISNLEKILSLYRELNG